MDAAARGYDGFRGLVTEFASGSRPWWPPTHSADRDAPNVVVILVDDLGFSDLSPFGSEIDTPHVKELAERGWVFSNYHTAPVCSPARAALLTGLNPHRAGFGFVAHVDPGYPGFACELPQDAPTLAESLRAGGYATFMVGKWHLTIESKLHDGAEKSSWPLQRGFDRYFGSMDGFTSLFHPHRLVSDNSPVNIEQFPDDFFLTDELTDRAIGMIDDLRTNDADKPFFLYYAHAAVHGPIQAKAVDIKKYRGRYAQGWDRIRERRFASQVERGIVASGALLPADDSPGSADIPAWGDLSPEQQKLHARHMEVYAAAVDEVDQSVGRIVSHLDRLGELDNTIFIITSDNGGSAEGGPGGTRSYFAQFATGVALPPDWVSDVPRELHEIGGPRAFAQYPTGWARVSNTPFRGYKASTYEGGVHAPLVIAWNRGEGERGLRDQFTFVTDLAPTILELVGVPALAERAGKAVQSIDGVSFASALTDSEVPSRREQYFECLGRRAMYVDGMKAVSTAAPSPVDGAAGGRWELYDLGVDPTEVDDLADRYPDVVTRLAGQWRVEGWRNTVFPLNDDGSILTVRPSTELSLAQPVSLPAFRPPLERFRAAKLTVLRSFVVDTEFEMDSNASGVIVSHGDQGGGYLLAIENGRFVLSYNAYGVMHRAISPVVAPGHARVTLSVDEHPGLRWSLALFLAGERVAEIESVPMLLGMAPFTGISVGYDYGSPVDWELCERHGSFRFTCGNFSAVRYTPGPRSSHDAQVLREIGAAVSIQAD